jgi:adenylate cyclase
MSDDDELRERLRSAGVEPTAVEEASGDGRLGMLAVEMALGGHCRHSLTAVAREARLSPDYVRALLQALGRPNPASGERAFTDEDIELARIARQLADAGLPRPEILDAARAIGQANAQVADTLRQLVGNAFMEPGDSDGAMSTRLVAAVEHLGPIVPPLLELTLRAHLRDGIRREMVTQAERDAGRLDDERDVAVAFADLVGYTRLGNNLSAPELGSLAGRYGNLAVKAVRKPVRLVKTLGDGAMFVSPDADKLVASLLDLRRRVDAADPALPPLRIGMTYGPATPRGGDWFGATVNLASRITEAAKPGQLLATEDAIDRARADDWKRRRKRSLRDVDGRLRLYSYEGDALGGS